MIDLRSWLPRRLRGDTPVVPLVRLSGAIGMPSAMGRGSLSLAAVDGALKRAFSVKGAKAVALALNSPGGSPVQSHLIFRRIRQLAEEKKLPVIAYVEDIAASGGYMLACAADEIVADRSSIVGSIGVVSATFGLDKAIARLGIDRRVYTAGTRKVTLDPFQPENGDDVEHLKTLQRDIHAFFIELVKGRRGDRLKEGEDLFSGLYWAGDRAVALGLADRVGTWHDDLAARYGDKVDIRVFEPGRAGFLRRRLFGGAADAAGGLVDFDDALASIERRAMFSRYGL
ncbi:S49 family peptidase [Pleomorphomonas koreensis]|uniref:S49 family peptidase n=1 Tax=Pleomorphomonas koreensis TaxID=257440 RepID=UPI0004269AD5|nr:S49 family peptidase [Pleomorphomonas koreensis]